MAVTLDDIRKLIDRIELRDHANGFVSYGPISCLCGATIPGDNCPRNRAIEHVSKWISQHLGEGHRIFPGLPERSSISRLH